MRVLILGVNGFVGRPVAAAASRRGLEVLGVSRSPAPAVPIQGAYLAADRRAPERVRQLVASRGIDVVVDVLAMTLEETEPLLAALDGEVAHYVMLSSCDVYRNYELLHRKATGTPVRTGLTETDPLRTSRYPYRGEIRPADAPVWLDGYDKIPIEEAVRQLTSDWTILRLPMIYGPGDTQRRFRWAVGPMAAPDAALTLPAAWAAWTTTYGYVDNVAAAVALVLGDARAFGCTFNIGEPAPRPHLAWAKRFATAMGWKGMLDIDDDPVLYRQWGLEALDLSVPLIVDDGQIRTRLGFTEIVDEATCLARTIADERTR